MRRLIFIFIVLLAVLVGCERFDHSVMKPQSAPEGEKVTISFKVAIPNDGEGTKAMGVTPTIDPDGFYIAVFGGSGYFNEWVKATVQQASTNYPSNSTVYNLTASFQVSDSRLRLHFIANCPVDIRTSPPISGSSDNEENVMSQIRSQRTETYNDGYWQKVILPNGIRANKNENNVYVPTPETVAQFPEPIVLVRNFARVYLRNITPEVGTQGVNVHQLVKIYKFGLAYAPAEGVIAPILSAPYTSNNVGAPITVSDDDDTTPLYFENFFINYQNYPISSLTTDPFNYHGYSPSNQSYDYYPAEGHTDRGAPLLSDLQTWDDEHPENNVLYVYERTIPTAGRRATRLIIQAERIDQNNVSDGVKFYALDIVNSDDVSVPLLRNQSYTVHLINIEAGTGEQNIAAAAQATSASVTGNPDFQNLINISDGKSSIGTSFTEQFYVKPQEDFVMFRFIPTNVEGEGGYSANQEVNDLVSISVGTVNTESGVFTELTPSQATSQGILTFKTEGGNYKVWIDKENGSVVQYVRSHNAWVEATSAQISNPQIEKWGMIKYELYDTNLDEGYYTQERSQAIHVSGTFNNRELSRNVVIKTSPRQPLIVTCEQKYVAQSAGEQEVLKIKIPTGLSRSVFPIDFTIEAGAYSLTPDGDVLPVAYGTSTIENRGGPAYYFVKTLTQAEYDALSTVDDNGTTWKVFECHFKTTVAQNASTIYVKNKFFTDAEADDEFYNYQQRLFTWSTTPNTVYRHGSTTFSFIIDNEHSSGTKVWWDPTNALSQSTSVEEARNKGLSTSNRVMPPILTVTLQGFTPQYQADGITPVTTGLEHHSGNTYWYYVGTGNPSNISPNITLALTATGAVGSTASVTLSTVNLTEAPLLFAEASTSIEIRTASFPRAEFRWTDPFYDTGDPVSFYFEYQNGVITPVTLRLTGAVPDGTDSRITGSNGTYTFTPSATDIANGTLNYTIGLLTSGTNGGLTASISGDGYNETTASHAALTGISISSNSLTLRPGGTSTLTASFTPNNLNPTPKITWETSNASVATVSNGTVTAVSPGRATITARAGSFTATCSIVVQRRTLHAASYIINLDNNNNSNTTSFTTSPQNVVFTNSERSYRGSGNNRHYYRLMGTRSLTWSGYSYSSGYYTVTAPTAYNDSRIIGISMTYDDGQNHQETTYTGNGNTTLTGTKSAWGTTNTSSTEEVSGYNTVKVTMSCTSSGEYDDRNRISSVTVYYGYFTYENPD